jgi:hypothetical protein
VEDGRSLVAHLRAVEGHVLPDDDGVLGGHADGADERLRHQAPPLDRVDAGLQLDGALF